MGGEDSAVSRGRRAAFLLQGRKTSYEEIKISRGVIVGIRNVWEEYPAGDIEANEILKVEQSALFLLYRTGTLLFCWKVGT